MDILLMGYITFSLAVIGAVVALAIAIRYAVVEHQERAYRRRTGR